MAHRAAVRIILGGTITASMFAELLDMLEEEGLTVEAEAVVFGRPLRLADDDRRRRVRASGELLCRSWPPFRSLGGGLSWRFRRRAGCLHW